MLCARHVGVSRSCPINKDAARAPSGVRRTQRAKRGTEAPTDGEYQTVLGELVVSVRSVKRRPRQMRG